MSLDHKRWGIAATLGPDLALLDWTSVMVSREDAEAALGRAPDFQDERTTSWGRVTREEAGRLLSREAYAAGDEDELRTSLADLYGESPDNRVSLYYVEPHRGL